VFNKTESSKKNWKKSKKANWCFTSGGVTLVVLFFVILCCLFEPRNIGWPFLGRETL